MADSVRSSSQLSIFCGNIKPIVPVALSEAPSVLRLRPRRGFFSGSARGSRISSDCATVDTVASAKVLHSVSDSCSLRSSVEALKGAPEA